MLRLDDATRGASGPTAEPQEGGASGDDTLLRTGRSDTLSSIAFRFYSPGGSSNLQLHVLAGVSTRKSPPPLMLECVVGPRKRTCQMTSKSVERFKQGARI